MGLWTQACGEGAFRWPSGHEDERRSETANERSMTSANVSPVIPRRAQAHTIASYRIESPQGSRRPSRSPCSACVKGRPTAVCLDATVGAKKRVSSASPVSSARLSHMGVEREELALNRTLKCTVCGAIVDVCPACHLGFLPEHSIACRGEAGHAHARCATGIRRRTPI